MSRARRRRRIECASSSLPHCLFKSTKMPHPTPLVLSAVPPEGDDDECALATPTARRATPSPLLLPEANMVVAMKEVSLLPPPAPRKSSNVRSRLFATELHARLQKSIRKSFGRSR